MFEKTREICDLCLELGIPGFDLSVFKDGEEVFRYMNGYSDIENKIKMTGKEIYNIYSCSKPITCTAALQLYEKGMFSLEDKLSDYMPEFTNMTVKTDGGVRPAKNPILIKHLFEMTAGFSYNIASENLNACRKETDGRCPTREAMKYLAKDPLLFEPGERWEYSLCHDVLAAFVEVVSGERFEEYVRKNIFEPLSMNDSTFMLPESKLETLAQQYYYENNKPNAFGRSIMGYKIGSEYASGGAGGISTVDDYIKFLEGLRKGLLIKPETLKLMATHRLSPEQNETYWTKETHGYGLGVRCPKEEGGIYGDIGWGGAAGAFLAVDLENAISLYFGMHMTGSPAQGIRSLLYRLVRAELLDNKDFDNIKQEIKNLYDYNLTY